MVVFVLRLENIFVWCDHRLPSEVLWVPLCPTTTAGFWEDLPATVVVSGGVLCVDGSAVFVLATYRTFQDVSLYGDGFMMGDGTGVGVASGTTAGATCWGWLGGSLWMAPLCAWVFWWSLVSLHRPTVFCGRSGHRIIFRSQKWDDSIFCAAGILHHRCQGARLLWSIATGGVHGWKRYLHASLSRGCC